MDLLLVLDYVSAAEETPPPFVSTVYRLARTWRGERYHRHWNAMESAARVFSQRLSAWFNANDYFAKRTTFTNIARYSIEKDMVSRMPAQKKTQTFNRESNWKGFLEYRLSDMELLDADEQVISDEELLESVVKLVESGYKLTASYSATTKSATATLQAGDALPKLSGWALSAKDKDARGALKLLLYKHFECLKEDWLPLLGSEKPVQRG